MDYKGLIEDLKDIYENYISELCGNDKLNCADLCVGKGEDCVIVQAISAIEALIKEREELVKNGHWTIRVVGINKRYVCSNCKHEELLTPINPGYCPRCGAKMSGILGSWVDESYYGR